MSLGLNVLKIFPAEQFGGVKTLKVLAGPYGDIQFLPTGGITLKTIKSYLEFPKVVSCGGSWIAPAELIRNKDFAQIKENAKEVIQVIQ